VHEDVLPTNFAKVEKSLASLGFFTPSSRRLRNAKVKTITFTREVGGKKVEATAEIVPSAISGLPITADQDKYLALQEMVTNIIQNEGKISNPIRFKSADLIRLLRNDTDAGKNYKEIYEWLDVMTSTTIVSNGVVYSFGQKRYVRDRFHVFDRSVSAGKELEDGTIADANYVWLSAWQLDNINNKYLLPIDLETYRQLRNHIAKALVPLLQVWLYASNKAGSFEKRYEDLCEILDVTKHRAPSLISRQLKPSLDELVHHGYLEKWRIEKMKTGDLKAYKVIFIHGPKFHRDRRKRIEQKNDQARVVVAQSESPDEPSPLELGKLEPVPQPAAVPDKTATRSRSATPRSASVEEVEQVRPQSQGMSAAEASDIQSVLLDALAARGLMASVAMKLLNALPAKRLESVPDYLEYWDSVKSAKDVGPGFLHELIKNGDPLPATFVTSRQREARRIVEERHNRIAMAKQSLDVAYEQYQEEALDRFIAEELPKEEYDRLYAAYKQQMLKQGSMFVNMQSAATFELMVRADVRAQIRKWVNVISFEEFCRREARRILADYQIDPAELGITVPPQSEETESNSGPETRTGQTDWK
jgi:hypothetical protein